MSEPRDDYLWDKSGAPDPDVRALELLLRTVGHDGRPFAGGRERPPALAPRRRHWRLWTAAAAAVAAALLLLLWFGRGEPTELAPGASARLFQSGKGELTVRLGVLATVTLQPQSELRFEHWRDGEQALFALQRGSIAARVAPPPAVPAKFFLVDTPRGRVVDLGCRYVLTLRSDGSVYVRVTEGLVEFEFPRRRVLVPAGADCIVDGEGPLTPLFPEASSELRAAVRKFDEATLKDAPAEVRGQALKELLTVIAQRPGRGVSLVLWHLLRDPDEKFREVAEAELVDLCGEPDAPTKERHWDPEVWLAHLRRLGF